MTTFLIKFSLLLLQEAERRAAYKSDVTYVTNSELGFDYLRDNLAQRGGDLVLRPFSYCIIDEVDSILIDEARTPLIISGTAEKPSEKYYKVGAPDGLRLRSFEALCRALLSRKEPAGVHAGWLPSALGRRPVDC